jgi:O-antigen ligase
MTTPDFHIEKLKSFAVALFAFSVLFSVTAVEGAMLLLAGAIILEYRKAREIPGLLGRLSRQPLFRPWMFYLAAGLVAAAFAVNKGKAFAYLPSDLIKYFCFSALLLGLTKDKFKLMDGAYLGGAAAAAALGIFQALRGLALGIDTRASAFAHPVRFGEIMLLALGLALAQIAAAEDRKSKIAGTAAAPLLFAALILSQTRGAYLGFLAAFAALFIFDKASRRHFLPFFGISLALCLAAVSLLPSVRYKTDSIAKGIQGTFSAMKSGNEAVKTHVSDEPINIRIELWKTGWKIFKSRPLTGVGPANVKKAFPDYYKGPLGGQETWGSLHNLYLHHLAERGIIGLAALLTLFGAMLALALKNLRTERNPHTLWAAIILPAYFVVNITEISFQHIHTSFAVFLALAASANSVHGRTNS